MLTTASGPGGGGGVGESQHGGPTGGKKPSPSSSAATMHLPHRNHAPPPPGLHPLRPPSNGTVASSISTSATSQWSSPFALPYLQMPLFSPAATSTASAESSKNGSSLVNRTSASLSANSSFSSHLTTASAEYPPIGSPAAAPAPLLHRTPGRPAQNPANASSSSSFSTSAVSSHPSSASASAASSSFSRFFSGSGPSILGGDFHHPLDNMNPPIGNGKSRSAPGSDSGSVCGASSAGSVGGGANCAPGLTALGLYPISTMYGSPASGGGAAAAGGLSTVDSTTYSSVVGIPSRTPLSASASSSSSINASAIQQQQQQQQLHQQSAFLPPPSHALERRTNGSSAAVSSSYFGAIGTQSIVKDQQPQQQAPYQPNSYKNFADQEVPLLWTSSSQAQQPPPVLVAELSPASQHYAENVASQPGLSGSLSAASFNTPQELPFTSEQSLDLAPLSLPPIDSENREQLVASHEKLIQLLCSRVAWRQEVLAKIQVALEEDQKLVIACQQRIAAWNQEEKAEQEEKETRKQQEILAERLALEAEVAQKNANIAERATVPSPSLEPGRCDTMHPPEVPEITLTDTALPDTTSQSTGKASAIPYAKLFSSAVSSNIPAKEASVTHGIVPQSIQGPLPIPVKTPEQDSADADALSRSASTNLQRTNQHEEQICRKWNRGECFKDDDCNYFHECLKCGGPHPRMSCPMFGTNASSDNPNAGAESDHLPEPCIKWNYRDCTWAEKCYRRHECLHCHGKHRIMDCPENPDLDETELPLADYTDEVCLNWNHGRCRMGDKCKRAHVCSQCGSRRHNVNDCPTEKKSAVTATARSLNAIHLTGDDVSDQGSYGDEVCLNWNNGRCKLARSQCRRSHVCSVCGEPGHAAIACPIPDLTPRDLVEAGVEICLNWNGGRCQDSTTSKSGVGSICKRVHICSVCKRSSHPAVRCDWDDPAKSTPNGSSGPAGAENAAPSSSDNRTSDRNKADVPSAAEICLNWNNNRCRLGSERCKRVHACLVCRSRDHTASVCPKASKETGQSKQLSGSGTNGGADDVCINWNQGRCRLGKKCKRMHVCSRCLREGHSQKECPYGA